MAKKDGHQVQFTDWPGARMPYGPKAVAEVRVRPAVPCCMSLTALFAQN